MNITTKSVGDTQIVWLSCGSFYVEHASWLVRSKTLLRTDNRVQEQQRKRTTREQNKSRIRNLQ